MNCALQEISPQTWRQIFGISRFLIFRAVTLAPLNEICSQKRDPLNKDKGAILCVIQLYHTHLKTPPYMTVTLIRITLIFFSCLTNEDEGTDTEFELAAFLWSIFPPLQFGFGFK